MTNLRRIVTQMATAGGRSIIRHALARPGRAATAFLMLAILVTPLLGVGGGDAPRVAAGPTFQSYLARLAEPAGLVVEGSQAAVLSQARQQARDGVAAVLTQLAAAGQAGAFSFDDSIQAFRADLTDAGRAQLAADRRVAAVEPASAVPTASRAAAESELPKSSATRSAQSVSSVNFIQVYSPFMWGRVSVNGLSVQLTLEDSSGNVIGVPSQSVQQPPKSVSIDPTQLYYETVFYDPANHSNPVTIVPGDRVHVVTSGTDPVTGQPSTEDKRIVVDDVRAWTSYEQDVVAGTAPPGSDMVITVATSLALSQYVSPSTYAKITADGTGAFRVAAFQTSTDSTYRSVDLKQGTTGFVRVIHPDLNEVYTVHGQQVFVPENSNVVHGWAFGLPSAPPNLQSGVTVSRPQADVTVTLKDSQDHLKASASTSTTGSYTVQFSGVTISGGDVVEVSLFHGPTTRVTAAPLAASVDLTGNQVTGTGPASTTLIGGIGRISGYIMKTVFTNVDFLDVATTTDSLGHFQSGQFHCGTTNLLRLQPGSFGYLGYEDSHYNFVYTDFAAPTTDVMSDFPFLEGWVADGTVRPSVTQRDGSGALKSQGVATPWLFYLMPDRIYINVYYNNADAAHYQQITPLQFFAPGDVVTVTSGAQTSTIPVDRVTAYLNSDAEVVAGNAPASALVRVIPFSDRSARREVTADGDGRYVAGSPFTNFNSGSCSETTKTEKFNPGDFGRAYVRHADGNQVFGVFARAMHVHEHENYAHLYLAADRTLDWMTVSPNPISAVLTHADGSAVSGQVTPTGTQCPTDNPSPGNNTLTCVTFKDTSGNKLLIRAGDSISVTFTEGASTATRQASFALNTLALVTGAPDVDTNTLAGVGPRDWSGNGTLTPPPTVNPSAITAGRAFTAYGPLQFLTSSGTTVTLVPGYSGQVSFSDLAGHRVYTAWAATALPVKIMPRPRYGDTRVCGKAAPGSTVRIHDVTQESQDIIIGTGTTDGQGNFCVTVSPALVPNEVIMAEADGTFSQPVVILPFNKYVPFSPRDYSF